MKVVTGCVDTFPMNILVNRRSVHILFHNPWRVFKNILLFRINAYTIIPVGAELIWDEDKRRSNIAKHGLDFADARMVLDSPYRLDIPVVRNGEKRIQSFSYVFGKLAVLTVVHIGRNEQTRVISFRLNMMDL